MIPRRLTTIAAVNKLSTVNPTDIFAIMINPRTSHAHNKNVRLKK